jgi:hypothetical protein
MIEIFLSENPSWLEISEHQHSGSRLFFCHVSQHAFLSSVYGIRVVSILDRHPKLAVLCVLYVEGNFLTPLIVYGAGILRGMSCSLQRMLMSTVPDLKIVDLRQTTWNNELETCSNAAVVRKLSESKQLDFEAKSARDEAWLVLTTAFFKGVF